MTGVVIIGASHAGVQAAASLRQAGWQDKITLIGEETEQPYHRPPLSKAFLTGEKSAEQLSLRGEAFFRDQEIIWLSGVRAERLDPRARKVTTSAGVVGYDRLILATGSRARVLAVPGAELEGVLSLRDIADARRLKSAIGAGGEIVIVGGGYIGLEVAATAAKAGRKVTVLESQAELLTRSAPSEIANSLAQYHRQHGVELRFGVTIEAIEGDAGTVRGVRLAGGERLPADLVLVGIGGIANAELAMEAGLELSAGGIFVDGQTQGNADGLYAIGDCATYRNPFTDSVMRLESVQNAVDQARAAAAHIASQPAPPDTVPWFWSDQYDVKLQIAGIAPSGCRMILRGAPDNNAWSLVCLDGERLAACFSINRPADHMAARRLIAARALIDPHAATDPDIPLLKAVAASPLRPAAE
ncbi:oxidoreductase [Nitratireductor mangrovi]|uniref:Oxidoreductase n=1 Tax=Nitratireductor mangrovi TaxID=2599600 RepID=A0A5B8L3Z2_9HYPH|nr:oxidoreductase [Nitratireductor mangrovi]